MAVKQLVGTNQNVWKWSWIIYDYENFSVNWTTVDRWRILESDQSQFTEDVAGLKIELSKVDLYGYFHK